MHTLHHVLIRFDVISTDTDRPVQGFANVTVQRERDSLHFVILIPELEAVRAPPLVTFPLQSLSLYVPVLRAVKPILA